MQNNERNATEELEDEKEGSITTGGESAKSNAKKLKAPKKKGYIESLDPKDSSAFDLTKFCLYMVAAVWALDIGVSIFCPDVAHELTDKVIDLLKYVVTACLGFFFGTSTKNTQQ